MLADLERLIGLQTIETERAAVSKIIAGVPARQAELDARAAAATAAVDAAKAAHASLSADRRNAEKEMAAAEARLSKFKDQQQQVKTNKEYQAYQKEIEASEKEIFAIEDDILQLMEECDVISKQLREKEAVVNTEIEKISAFRKELDAEAAEHEKELNKLKEERVGIVAGLEPDIYNIYMALLRDSGDGVAVTTARNELCSGCNMNIPPQLYVEIRKNEEVLQCPQCRRILYASEE